MHGLSDCAWHPHLLHNTPSASMRTSKTTSPPLVWASYTMMRSHYAGAVKINGYVLVDNRSRYVRMMISG